MSANSNWSVGPAASNWNPADNWCLVEWKSYNDQSKNTMVLWKGRSRQVEFKRSKCSKQEAQRLRKHKLKPWQEVEKGSHGNWSTRKETKGHNSNASQRPKASSKDQDTTSDMLSHLQTEISMISIFRIDRSVMEALSSWKCFNMPTHCNSDVFTTYGQDQDTGSAGDVLECPSHEIKSFKQSMRKRSKTQCRLDGCESLICIALKMVQ